MSVSCEQERTGTDQRTGRDPLSEGIFKTSRLEQLFRDGALGPLHPPPSDFCLYNIGLYELGIDPADVLPPLKPV